MTIYVPDLAGRAGPRYRAIADAVADDAAAGRIATGDRLPTHRALADRLGVTVGTVTRAYALLAERGTPGEAYNIASGSARSMRELLDVLMTMTDAKIDVQPDPSRMRPSALPILEGDITRISRATGWKPA